MCISPIVIRNPNYGLKDNGLRNVWDETMAVNCGHCYECIATRQSDYAQRVTMESLKNEFFFATLTYSDAAMPVLGTSLGYDIRFADVRDIQDTIRRIRKYNLFGVPFRYLGVSERGSKKGRPHFHVLFIIDKEFAKDYNECLNLEHKLYMVLKDEWKRNYGTRKNPEYRPNFEYKVKFSGNRKLSNYDLHYVIPHLTEDGVSNVCYYVLKYMFKPSDFETRLQQALALNYTESEYLNIWSVVRSRCFHSLHLGLDEDPTIQKYLRQCIDRTDLDSPFPQYFSPVNGQSAPLARQYRRNPDIYNVRDAKEFMLRAKEYYRDINRSQQLTKLSDFERKSMLVQVTGCTEEFDFVEED